MQIGDLVQYNYKPVEAKGLHVMQKIGLIIAKRATPIGMKYRVQWDSGISQWYHEAHLIIVNEMGRTSEPVDS